MKKLAHCTDGARIMPSSSVAFMRFLGLSESGIQMKDTYFVMTR